MIDCLLSMRENLDLIPNTENNEKDGVWAVIFLWEGQPVPVEGQCDSSTLSGGVLRLPCQGQFYGTEL